MLHQVKVYDKDGKLKKVIPPEELTANHWNNIDTTIDLTGLNDYDGELDDFQQSEAEVFICPECGYSEVVLKPKEFCSSDCATRVRNRKKREQELGYYE